MFKAAILVKPKKIEINNFKLPIKLRDDQVLVKLKYSGVCGSQIMEYLGKRGRDKYFPHTFGHEAVGTIVKKGRKVKKVKVKDRVILSWIKGKGLDYGGFSLINEKGKKINFGPVSTFSSYTIASENRVSLQPAKMSDIESVLYGCAIPTGAGMVINQLKNLKKNHKVCLIGVGGIGMAALLTLIKKKSKIHIIEKNKSKKIFLERFKVNFLEKKNFKKFRNYFDFCIESSGTTIMIEKGFEMIKKNGTLVFASHPDNSKKIKLNPHDLISGKKIYGSWGGCCKPDKDIKKIFNYFENKNIFSRYSKISFFNLENIENAFRETISGKINRAIIKF
jgi:S-(hydroxymethyl)glutathione dehydrogenase/alcohol dehydrogenase